jgi:hypothetical protein
MNYAQVAYVESSVIEKKVDSRILIFMWICCLEGTALPLKLMYVDIAIR